MVDDSKLLKAKALTASAGVKIKNAKSSGYKADKASSDAADAAATPGDEAVAAAEKAETLAKEAAKAAADALDVAEAAFEAVKNAGFEPDSKVYKEAAKAVSTATDLKKEADAAVVRATKAVAEAKEAKEEAKPAPAPGGGEEGSPAGSDDEQSDGDSAIPTPGSQAAPGSDPDQKGEDGTEVGPGASAASADKAIKNMPDDKDPAGSVYSRLRLRSPKQTSTSIKLTWKKDSKAVKYVIYGNKCGKTTKPKKLATVKSKTTKTFKKVAGKKLRKGTYYKFIIVALDKNNNVVSTSKLIHVATKGGKVGNFKKVIFRKGIIKKAKNLTPGKKLSITAKAVVQSGKLKVRVHRGLKYESSNKKIATVTSKGVIKAKKKGSCYIYVYTQNGIYRSIKVTVK